MSDHRDFADKVLELLLFWLQLKNFVKTSPEVFLRALVSFR